jgi:hypothetical protein
MSLKIDHTPQTVNAPSQAGSSQKLLCCFDVSKASLSLFAQYEPGAGSEQAGERPCQIDEQLPNQTGAIEQVLIRLEGVAEEAGLDGLHVLAEPTGGYEKKLLQTARRLGYETGLISPEHVARLKTVESNDTGKTDHKDPRVMHLVARLGKTQTDRHLPERYRKLRRLTRYYDEDEETLTAARQRIQAVISDLFPDYDKSATFTFDTTGQALMDAYAFNPYHIQRAGLGRFKSTTLQKHNETPGERSLLDLGAPFRTGRRIGSIPQNGGRGRTARRATQGPLGGLHPPYGPQKGPSRPDRGHRTRARCQGGAS